jgi:hypothetical protein
MDETIGTIAIVVAVVIIVLGASVTIRAMRALAFRIVPLLEQIRDELREQNGKHFEK